VLLNSGWGSRHKAETLPRWRNDGARIEIPPPLARWVLWLERSGDPRRRSKKFGGDGTAETGEDEAGTEESCAYSVAEFTVPLPLIESFFSTAGFHARVLRSFDTRPRAWPQKQKATTRWVPAFLEQV
jgi:hypothetical protein